MTQQRHEELACQRGTNGARGFTRLGIAVAKDRKEIEGAAAERDPVHFTEGEVTDRIHADEQDVGVVRMEGDEVADIGLEPADLLAARIEGMEQADLIAWPNAACIAGAQRQCDGRGHAVFRIRALMIWGRVRATSPGTAAMQRA